MKKYRSPIARACHEDAEAMFEVGAIDSKTMHEFDVNCLVPSAVPVRETSAYNGENQPRAPIAAVAAARA